MFVGALFFGKIYFALFRQYKCYNIDIKADN